MKLCFPQDLYSESIFSELLMDHFVSSRGYIVLHGNKYLKKAFEEIDYSVSILKERVRWYNRIWEAYRIQHTFDSSYTTYDIDRHISLHGKYQPSSDIDMLYMPDDIQDILYNKLQILPISKYHNLPHYYNWTDEEIINKILQEKLVDDFSNEKNQIIKLNRDFATVLNYCSPNLNYLYVPRMFSYLYNDYAGALNQYIVMPSFVDAVNNNSKFVLQTDIYSFTQHVRYTYQNFNILYSHIELTEAELEFVKNYTAQSISDYNSYNSIYDTNYESLLRSKISRLIEAYAIQNSFHRNFPESYYGQTRIFTEYANQQVGA